MNSTMTFIYKKMIFIDTYQLPINILFALLFTINYKLLKFHKEFHTI